jgi:hypothetical protein
MVKFGIRNIRRCVYTAVNMEPSMWHDRVRGDFVRPRAPHSTNNADVAIKREIKNLWRAHKTTKLKILQTRFDCACSWTVKCKLPPTSSGTGFSSIQHLTWNVKIWNFETSADMFIRRLTWDLQCDMLWSFHEKRRKTVHFFGNRHLYIVWIYELNGKTSG